MVSYWKLLSSLLPFVFLSSSFDLSFGPLEKVSTSPDF